MKYNYVCLNKDCKDYNKTIVINHSMKENNKTHCYSCDKETLQKKIEQSNFILNGIGLYKKNTY